MATEPVLEVILAQLVTDLKTIATPTHSQTVGSRVHRTWPNEAVRQDPQPAIYLFGPDETKFLVGNRGDTVGLGVPIGIQGALLELNVVFLAKCTGSADRESIGRRFYADIESVLVPATGDRSIGNSVVRVEVDEVSLYVQDAYEQQAGGHAIFLLYYEHAMGDPRTGVGSGG